MLICLLHSSVIGRRRPKRMYRCSLMGPLAAMMHLLCFFSWIFYTMPEMPLLHIITLFNNLFLSPGSADPALIPAGTGWTFDRGEAQAMRDATYQALYTYREHRDSFYGIQERGMQQDLSWEVAAQQYEEVMVAAKYQW